MEMTDRHRDRVSHHEFPRRPIEQRGPIEARMPAKRTVSMGQRAIPTNMLSATRQPVGVGRMFVHVTTVTVSQA